MTIARRQVLLGVTTLALSTLAGRFSALSTCAPRNPPDERAATSAHGIVLHDGRPMGLVFARQVQASSPRVRFDHRAVSVLTLDGYTQLRAVLAGASGKLLFALFDDAESLVTELLLEANGAAVFVRRRHGQQMLLTARL